MKIGKSYWNRFRLYGMMVKGEVGTQSAFCIIGTDDAKVKGEVGTQRVKTPSPVILLYCIAHALNLRNNQRTSLNAIALGGIRARAEAVTSRPRLLPGVISGYPVVHPPA